MISEKNTEEKAEEIANIGKGRGRKRYRSISKTGIFVRPFNHTKRHIEKMVRELKLKDKNFETESAALRHYASVGIAAETATSDLRNSLDNTIVKKSIKQAAHDEITLLKKDLEKAVDLIKEFSQRNAEDFADIARRTDFIESKVERVLEGSKILPREPVVGEASSSSEAKIAAQKKIKDARQAVVLKSLFKAFYIAQILDQVPATENDYTLWANALNNEIHVKVNALPPKELMEYASTNFHADRLRAFAKQIVNQVALNLQQSRR